MIERVIGYKEGIENKRKEQERKEQRRRKDSSLFTIRVTESTRTKLQELKKHHLDSYDKVIQRLIEVRLKWMN